MQLQGKKRGVIFTLWLIILPLLILFTSVDILRNDLLLESSFFQKEIGGVFSLIWITLSILAFIAAIKSFKWKRIGVIILGVTPFIWFLIGLLICFFFEFSNTVLRALFFNLTLSVIHILLTYRKWGLFERDKGESALKKRGFLFSFCLLLSPLMVTLNFLLILYMLGEILLSLLWGGPGSFGLIPAMFLFVYTIQALTVLIVFLATVIVLVVKSFKWKKKGIKFLKMVLSLVTLVGFGVGITDLFFLDLSSNISRELLPLSFINLCILFILFWQSRKKENFFV
jgi:hypothetical protein